MMDVSMLTPEEIDLMKNALNEYETQHSADPQDDENASFEKIADGLEMLVGRVEAIEKRMEKLECIVMDDIIGGVRSLYDTERRGTSINDLKSKYGSMFDPLIPGYKALVNDDNIDIYEKLEDVIEELHEKEDYSDEMGDSEIKNIYDQLKSKLDQIKSLDIGEPKAASIEVVSEPTASSSDIVEKIKKMKAAAGDVKY